jgi:type I restriction-modification system DNA methylase subunit
MELADVVLSAPPVGVLLGEDTGMNEEAPLASKNTSFDVVSIERALSALKQTGRAIFLLPQGLLFGGGARQELRKRLVADGRLTAIISFPTGVLAPLTHIRTALVVLDGRHRSESSSVMMVDAADSGEQLGRRVAIMPSHRRAILGALKVESSSATGVRSRCVPTEEIARQNFDLQPLRYISISHKSDRMSDSDRRARIVALDMEYRGISTRMDELLEAISRST